MKTWKLPVLFAALLTAPFAPESVHAAETIYDETLVPPYTLPDPFVTTDGRLVTSAKTWTEVRRPELLHLFETHVYGRAPGRTAELTTEVFEESDHALGDKAVRRQVAVYPFGKTCGMRWDLLIYLPTGTKGPTPAFLGLNFGGNHTVQAERAIRLNESWMRNGRNGGVVNHRATEATRGSAARRWPVEAILAHGYALATVYYGDIDPDFDDGFQNGVHPFFQTRKGAKPAPDEWGSIAAWAWGLSRVLDCFVASPALGVDPERVAVIGHSRLGKTALWAGATDERFALVVSNDSGCGGAALSRRRFGESVRRINTVFPHWFCDNFNRYNDRENDLPVDQHELIALMAPRPVYVASAEQDRWADPHGEFLSAQWAGEVYRLFGLPGLPAARMPGVNQPVRGGYIGYHIRTGKHDLTAYDWSQYLRFADEHLPAAGKR